ncbi:hypothetical protein ACFY2R_01580 [Micromonospora olivasterospora]|uniref:Uncharacterized protein n=1 Tax=Micromonospora olivasterospora TaxID=1880 RepID=A0A562ICJ2_MICOL|nr:hypothetical protein [Micromonospora olivasterospora]TWH68632.1 hypothetical protein JD77_03629 [Micromonospora olivasterospora]
MGPAAAEAAPPGASSAPTQPLVPYDRIAGARLLATRVGPTSARFQADFHERLAAWLAFWSANSPPSWSTPVEVVAEVAPAGDALTLHSVRVRRGEDLADRFTAARLDAAHRATEASLHHHFPSVRRLPDGTLRVRDGSAAFTGSPDQLAFVAGACRELWGLTAAGAADWRDHANAALGRAGHRLDVASRSGWAAFTRTSLRLGLRTETYQ